MRLLLVLCALSLLLAFGCTGQKAAKGIGDSDISSQQGDDSNLMPDEDLLPPGVEGDIDSSDIGIEEETDYDFISEEDVVEPV